MKARHVQPAPAGATLEGVPRCQWMTGVLLGWPWAFPSFPSGCLAFFASQDPWQPRQGNRKRYSRCAMAAFEAKHGRHQVELSQPRKKRRQASRKSETTTDEKRGVMQREARPFRHQSSSENLTFDRRQIRTERT